jgi:hypothetical protein
MGGSAGFSSGVRMEKKRQKGSLVKVREALIGHK